MTTLNPLPCLRCPMDRRTTNEIVLLDAGSYPGQGLYENQTYTFTHASGVWTNQSSASPIDPLAPPARLDAAGSNDGTYFTVFGGREGSETGGMLDDTWSYAGPGVGWTKQNISTYPFARYGAKMAYAGTVAGGALLFGGCNQLNLLSESWLYTPGTPGSWQQLNPSTVPPARYNHAMSGGSNTVLLYGGENTSSIMGDTYLFSGSASTGNWVKQNPTTTIPWLTKASMCYDSVANAFVMFGGETASGVIAPPTTYTWQSSNWTAHTFANTTSATPPSRIFAQFAFDGTNCILMGGCSTAGAPFYDVWAWNTTALTWTQLQ